MSETPKEKTLAALQQLTETSAISPLQALRIAWDGGYAAGFVAGQGTRDAKVQQYIPEPKDKRAYFNEMNANPPALVDYALIGGQPNPHRSPER